MSIAKFHIFLGEVRGGMHNADEVPGGDPAEWQRRQFGERIGQERRWKSLREWRDVPQKEIADGSGVSESSLSKWESGQTSISEESLAALARYFGVTPAWLRYGVPPREPLSSLGDSGSSGGISGTLPPMSPATRHTPNGGDVDRDARGIRRGGRRGAG